MCVSVPGQIVEIIDPVHRLAKVDISGQEREVNLALLSPEESRVGEWVLVHAGLALRPIDEAKAVDTLAVLAELLQVWSEEELR